ncbi:E3 ubiquitin-protein ligase NRDP1-like [Saccoglossus kowalevskii]
MGFEIGRFQGEVDEELVCPICSGVLEEPVQAPQCEHAFCTACIQEWLSRQHTCPVDRNSITPQQLKAVPRILRNLLSRFSRVTRWGGMISTPDAVLQAVIKRSLIDSACPAHIVTELMESAHERNWPPGLNTLETRQLNRHTYEQYVTRRIPGKQAVVVMSHDNQHMGEDFTLDPGLVMIFAHGIE